MMNGMRSLMVMKNACRDLAAVESLEPRRLLSGYTLSTLAKFPNNPSQGEMVEDAKGDLFFFSTTVPGATGQEAIFELAKGSRTPTRFVTLPAGVGANVSGLTIDSAGDLFGTDRSDGVNSNGTLWEIVKGSNSFFTLASFTQVLTGAFPNQAHLVIDGSGNIFGTCQNGGASNAGTVWELRHGMRTITELASLPSSGVTFGTTAPSGLTIDAAGNLYGTIGADVSTNDVFGSVWELQFQTQAIITLASFNGIDGSDPQSPLVVDSSGDIFGVTTWGGSLSDGVHPSKGDGAIFEIQSGGRAIIPLASFTGANGTNPTGGLVADSHGNLFGATKSSSLGSSTNGVIFELPKNASNTTTLFQLTQSTGVQPGSDLFINGSGDLIDATNFSIFQLTPPGGGGGGGGTGAVSGVLSGKLPATATAGQKVKINQTLKITDTGTGPVIGSVNAKLFLATGTTIDSNSIKIGIMGRHAQLNPNGHFSLKFPTALISASVPAGVYHVVAQITDPHGNISEAASGGTITVA